uniref:Uncharacterized protein n=1 Tax=Avena sativa TaxID=4498 RepID=A0ACD5ZTG4_AVESA
MAGSISAALLLLLNMAGALLSPRAPQAPPAADDEAVDFFFFPFLVLYKSGRVERFMGTDAVPASVDPATGVASKDVAIDAAAGLAVRLYLPNTTTAEKLPLLVFYHGGAFVTESAFSPTYQRYLNALVSKAGVLAVSVDYHLSPERRLPTAYDDAWTVLRWAVRVRGALAGSPRRPHAAVPRRRQRRRQHRAQHGHARRPGGPGRRRDDHPGHSAAGSLLLGEASRAVGDAGPGGAAVAGPHVELRLRGEVRRRRPGDQPGGHGEGRVAAARVRARAGDRGGAGHAERQGPRVRRRARRQRVGRRGAAVRDARRGPRLLSFKARRREGGQGDGGGRGLHQRQPIT